MTKSELGIHLPIIDRLRYGLTSTKRYKNTNNQLCLSCNKTKVPRKEEQNNVNIQPLFKCKTSDNFSSNSLICCLKTQ